MKEYRGMLHRQLNERRTTVFAETLSVNNKPFIKLASVVSPMSQPIKILGHKFYLFGESDLFGESNLFGASDSPKSSHIAPETDS